MPRFLFIVLGLSLVLLLAVAKCVNAQENHHPPEDQAIHEQFYNTWMRPDDPRYSCCGKGDCYPVEAQMRGGHWWFNNRDTGKVATGAGC